MLTHAAIRTGFSRAANNPAPRAHAAGGSFFDSINLMGAIMPYGRDAEIYGENEPAEYVYRVISGAVRTYKVLGDGRRQVGAFYLPGDIFGFETNDKHLFSAEAIADAKILFIRRSALLALAERETDIARQLWSITGEELRRRLEREFGCCYDAHAEADGPGFRPWLGQIAGLLRELARQAEAGAAPGRGGR